MKKKTLIYILFGVFVFIGLVLFNMTKAQKAIKEEQPAPLSINVDSYPKSLKKDEAAKFVWNINATSDLTSKFTTIYWSYESSPSALPKNASPDAVKYPYYSADYTTGDFRLPENFELNLHFPKIGKVYFRAYALVGKDHLWSGESVVDIIE